MIPERLTSAEEEEEVESRPAGFRDSLSAGLQFDGLARGKGQSSVRRAPPGFRGDVPAPPRFCADVAPPVAPDLKKLAGPGERGPDRLI